MRCASPPASVPDDAVEVEVVEADVEQELEALVDLLLHALGDHLVALGELHRAQELGGLADRQLAELVEVDPADRDRERRRPEARALARGARHLAHVALDLLARPVALGFGVPALEPRHHALEAGGVRARAAVPVAVADVDVAVAGAVQHRVPGLLAQLLPRCVDVEAVLLGEGFEDAVEVAAAESRPRRDRAVGEAQVVVGHHQLGIDLEARAQPVAALARAVRRVEGEVARRELVEREAAVVAREVLGERERLGGVAVADVSARDDLHLRDALGEAERGLERVGEPTLDPRPAHQPVDHDLDRVLLVALEPDDVATADEVGELVQIAVDPYAREALARELLEQPFVLALAAPHHRREHLEARALGELEHPVDDLLRRLAGDDPTAVRAVRDRRCARRAGAGSRRSR